MKKYITEFLVIFIGVTASFIVDEWRENRQNRVETLKALKLIQFDIQIDTNYYHLRLNRLDRIADRLSLGLTSNPDTLTENEISSILKGLRGNADYQVQKYGYNYLVNNIQYPSLKNDTIVTNLGMYHALSSGYGNYWLFNLSHYEAALDNYNKLFSVFPNYLSPDTAIVYHSIRRNRKTFFNDPYWLGRINMMYRESTDYMPRVYNKNLKFAEHILKTLEKEIGEE